MRQRVYGSGVKRFVSWTLLISLLVVSGGGCALAVVPGLIGIGAGGYLWGKQHGQEQAEEKAAADGTDELSAAAARERAKR
jgi:uncharacterized protein HemX